MLGFSVRAAPLNSAALAATTTMDFPERHPLLGLYRVMARVLCLFGVFGIVAGIGMSRFMARYGPLTRADISMLNLKCWGFWLAGYGKIYGSFLLFFSCVIWLYVRLIRKDTLFGDRIRREY